MSRLQDGLIPLHGGPDALGVPRWDFSTNSNACGPCPIALEALAQADATHYPDPGYHALRVQLGAFHAVAPERIVVAASASEFIFRITAWAVRQGVQRVTVPRHGYGDYTQAARAWGLEVLPDALLEGQSSNSAMPKGTEATGSLLRWAAAPSSPLGQEPSGLSAWVDAAVEKDASAFSVLDSAYAPLRLEGRSSLSAHQHDQVWRLFSPNKALGLTGVRGAYAIAPAGLSAVDLAGLQALAPSWPLGAHGVALLQAWCQPATQDWLAQSLLRLRDWKDAQTALCAELGWTVLPSVGNFFTVRAPPWFGSSADWQRHLQAVRRQGLKVRDASSFGLPGHWRLAVLPPSAQSALGALQWKAP